MFHQLFIRFSGALFLLALVFSACKKNRENLPLVTTLNAYSISSNSALGGGVLYSDGNVEISSKGLCWSTGKNPTIDHNKTDEGPGPETFTSTISGLSPSTTYYIRAYATNALGTSYGSQVMLTTSPAAPLALVETNTPINVTINSAMASGKIYINKGDAPILQSGLCWSKDGTPDTNSSHLNVKPDFFGNISAALTGLQNNTSYSICAYATNSTGVSYGPVKEIKTFFGSMTDNDGNSYYTVMIAGKEWMAENLQTKTYRNGNPITYAPLNNTWYSAAGAGGYCFYENDPSYRTRYGNLYNYAAVVNSGEIAPEGWHVPSYTEMSAMFNSLGGDYYAGETMKSPEGDWGVNSSSNNKSGFSAKAAGYRSESGYFYGQGSFAYYWTSTSYTSTNARALMLSYYNSLMITDDKRIGYSVRLVRD